MNKIKVKLNKYIKNNEQIVCITCYDASFSKILNDLEVDIVLVGDSLGMVIKGEVNTHNVTIKEALYHTACVAKYKKDFILMADMPINSYDDPSLALINAKKFIEEKVDIVKLEYQDNHEKAVKEIIKANIPVCGHLGFLPQYATKKEEIKIYGKNKIEQDHILSQAKKLDSLGVSLILLECVYPELSKIITDSVSVPVIGIGSGEMCNGQVQVLYDIIGISNNPPRFSKDYLKGSDNIASAIKNFYNYVKAIQYNK
ncbi:MAG: 3-methyl-2-oxobutanoate hydroxymethyltransferase [Gammaproteobacteria bacterium]|jgi:3-methyl-2-oxobutanoate hydroxymethyltransferase|nr:3-methyl-2-oxobutanoate hydroxymethyltransferase [Gammaproteobacteria bacterium]MBT7603147.1 3-methyl-2-oxobutanoate hydroxymethyltransferase [Gammaproteobacteria bacterium]